VVLVRSLGGYKGRSSRISPAMLRGDSFINSANGACGIRTNSPFVESRIDLARGRYVTDWLISDFTILGIHFQGWMPLLILIVAATFWLAFGRRT
jgi:hypothetical protein